MKQLTFLFLVILFFSCEKEPLTNPVINNTNAVEPIPWFDYNYVENYNDTLVVNIEFIYNGICPIINSFKDYDIMIHSNVTRNIDYMIQYNFYHGYYDSIYTEYVVMLADDTVAYRGYPFSLQYFDNISYDIEFNIESYDSNTMNTFKYTLGNKHIVDTIIHSIN